MRTPTDAERAEVVMLVAAYFMALQEREDLSEKEEEAFEAVTDAVTRLGSGDRKAVLLWGTWQECGRATDGAAERVTSARAALAESLQRLAGGSSA
ncbi:hypothetical protein F0U59_26790 [Archangium gephyra]|nr:hypothetical protein F0U59_26790 [Archangium gephyra]